MKRCKYTDKYPRQVWISAFACLLSCLVGLGQIAYGIWLVLHNVKVAGLLGGRIIYVTGAFAGCGGFASFIALFGVVVYILRRRHFIIMHVILTVLSILFLCVVWAMIYIEQRKVATQLSGRLQLAENVEYYNFIDYQYNCNLQNVTTEQQRNEFQRCASFFLRQTWTQVYALLGLCGALICVQSVIVLMGGMMCRLLKHAEHRTHPIRAINPIVTHVNPRTVVTEEDMSGSSETTSMEMTHVQPSAPARELPVSHSFHSPPSIHHVSSPPFHARDGFALSYSNPNARHNGAPRQRQPSITQL